MHDGNEASGGRRLRAVNLWLFCAIAALLCGAAALRAQEPPPYAPLGIDELQQLVAPIALYPDALLAQVLTASTYPDDVIAAARWEDAGNDPNAIDSQPWDSSVKGVARYPSVLHYMAANADWMNDLGDAFMNQQPDVMSAVQNLRGEALAAGTLASTPQQTVVNQDGYIQIIPTDPQYLYVPQYDPNVVYAPPALVVGSAYPAYITFGPRVEVGDWLDFDLDWHDRAIYSGHWGRDRPWWHLRDRDEAHHYLEDRPGIYQPGRFKDEQGRPINAAESRWTRDARRPAPHMVARPAARAPVERPGSGYPPRAAAPANRPPENPRGADVARQSERGKTSRQSAPAPAQRPAPQPAQRAPQPAQRAPEPQQRAPQPAQRTPEPVQHAPQPAQRAPEPTRAPAQHAPQASRPPARPAAPAPAARPSAPTRGGAMGGYQSGQAASASAARGAASRGKR